MPEPKYGHRHDQFRSNVVETRRRKVYPVKNTRAQRSGMGLANKPTNREVQLHASELILGGAEGRYMGYSDLADVL